MFIWILINSHTWADPRTHQTWKWSTVFYHSLPPYFLKFFFRNTPFFLPSLKIYKKDIIFMRKQTFSRALSRQIFNSSSKFFPPSSTLNFSLSESVSRNRFRYRNFGRKMSFFLHTHSSANTHIYTTSEFRLGNDRKRERLSLIFFPPHSSPIRDSEGIEWSPDVKTA